MRVLKPDNPRKVSEGAGSRNMQCRKLCFEVGMRDSLRRAVLKNGHHDRASGHQRKVRSVAILSSTLNVKEQGRSIQRLVNKE